MTSVITEENSASTPEASEISGRIDRHYMRMYIFHSPSPDADSSRISNIYAEERRDRMPRITWIQREYPGSEAENQLAMSILISRRFCLLNLNQIHQDTINPACSQVIHK